MSQVSKPKGGLPYPEAVRVNPFLKPPAVWFPYKKVGQSATGELVLEGEDGALPAGGVALYAWGMDDVRFTDIVVRAD